VWPSPSNAHGHPTHLLASQISQTAFSRLGARERGDTSGWTDTPQQAALRAAGLLTDANGGGPAMLTAGAASAGAAGERSGPVSAVLSSAMEKYRQEHRGQTLLEQHMARQAAAAKGGGGKPPKQQQQQPDKGKDKGGSFSDKQDEKGGSSKDRDSKKSSSSSSKKDKKRDKDGKRPAAAAGEGGVVWCGWVRH
jgi:hypothetical protein